MQYTTTGKGLLLIALAGFIAVDCWSISERCILSPSVSEGGVFVSVIFELCALAAIAFAMQHFSLTAHRPHESSYWSKTIFMALFLSFLSVCLFRQAVLFADTFPKGRVHHQWGTNVL